ncbi:MAG: cytochrome b/b6 domain-containing protein [Sutterellaceae bacterium]|nr:cytochrome b/b6 domain-containing protein [Burkholderiaceae bacterium]MDW8429026.1 cytochrome b/b6 domain-containing protein [Sutterellaceae bacterium]
MSGTPRLRVWDLPTRLFHWALALLVVCSVVTAQVGGLWMDWHLRAGYAALALLLFRLLWGVFGSRYARFTQFVRGPSAVLAYLRALRTGGAAPQAGHNPLGALSVLAMLAALLVQAATGLFANDAIATEGPLAKFVSGSTSDFLTRVHKLNQYVLYTLVALHVAAIAFYRVIKREDLLRPMITGDRTGVAGEPARDDLAMRLRAALLLALAAGAVAYLVTR